VFDGWIVLVLSILGDLIPDTLYYAFGRLGRVRFFRRREQLVDFTSPRMKRLEEQLIKHFRKTMVVLKLTPVVTTIGLMLVGYLRLSFRRFLLWCAIVTVPKSIIFLLIGYFFGQAYNINTYLHDAALFLPLIIVGIVLASTVYGFVSRRILHKVEQI
jgi:membrane protein DedA with SNARE-associated domain